MSICDPCEIYVSAQEWLPGDEFLRVKWTDDENTSIY